MMNLTLTDQLDIKGHLQISKLYRDGREEVIFDDENTIVSGMGVGLAYLFTLSGSQSILDYQIDRFQVGVSGNSALQVVSTNSLSGPLSSLAEYGTDSDLNLVIYNQVKTPEGNAIFALIPAHKISRVNATTVRYTIILDQDACNDLTRNGNSVSLSEIGLFMKNPRFSPAGSILVAYKSHSPIKKTNEFSLAYRWNILL